MTMLNRRVFRPLSLSLAVIAALGAVALAKPAAAQTTVKWAYVYEPGEPHHKGAVFAAEQIEKQTNGKYKIQLFPSAVLGKESDLNQGLSLGTVDMTISAASFQAQVAKRIGVAYFPFVFRDFDHVMAYARSDIYKEFAEDYRKATGNHIVALTYAAERQVTSNKPVLKPEDMRGLKIRVPDAAAYMAFPKALSANPTPIALAEVYLALQSGVVDAQENAFNTIWSRKFHEVQKHIMLTGHVIDSLNSIISGGLWAKLSPDDRKIFVAAMQAGALLASQQIREQDTQLMNEIKKLNVTTIHTVDKEAFRKAVLANSKPEDFGYQRNDYDRILALK
ncbi:sialic acid TRAP transporter substrate-binding protein SiaP [Ferrovibrio terrae]|uniref:sialic acid TRAP transporter substrate-binding protein SiaP n=1 Tax=Ferrovibrio terrae TaxID=2594003 RepID=UPI003138184D